MKIFYLKTCLKAHVEWCVVVEEWRGQEQSMHSCQRYELKVTRSKGQRTVEDYSTAMGGICGNHVVPCDSRGISETPRSWHLSTGHMLTIGVHEKFCFSLASE